MLSNQMVDVETTVFSMAPKFTSKGFKIDDLKTLLALREATFNQLWNGRLSGKVPEIPSLDTVKRTDYSNNIFNFLELTTHCLRAHKIFPPFQTGQFRYKKNSLLART